MADGNPIGEALTRRLNDEGYSFQAAVIKAIQESRIPGEFGSVQYQTSELPVSVGERDTRIDFVLKVESASAHMGMHIVGECQRADPAASHWCFAIDRRDPPGESSGLIIESIARRAQGPSVFTADSKDALGAAETKPLVFGPSQSQRQFHVGTAVGTGDDRAPGGDASGIIERTADQVMLGVNGYFEFLATRSTLLGQAGGSIAVLPVIVTTASLYECVSELSAASLATGELPAAADVRPCAWLWLQYHVARRLRHHVHRYPLVTSQATIAGSMKQEFVRSIAIVQAPQLDQFLREAPSFLSHTGALSW